MPHAVRIVDRRVWRAGTLSEGQRRVPEECPLSMTFNGGSYAVMMGTPQDLADFAIGFSLNEGIIGAPDDLISLDIVELDDGVELRMWLAPEKAERIAKRRRYLAGPTGCGICGVDSIAEAVRPVAVVQAGRSFTAAEIMSGLSGIEPLQLINHETRAVHAAAFWTPMRGVVALREDVGRHNALDKLTGHLAQTRAIPSEGLVLLTSRVSVEMVQKTASIGAPFIVAVSAPTALAVKMADRANITLVAIARNDGFEIFTHPQRVITNAGALAQSAETGTIHVVA